MSTAGKNICQRQTAVEQLTLVPSFIHLTLNKSAAINLFQFKCWYDYMGCLIERHFDFGTLISLNVGSDVRKLNSG